MDSTENEIDVPGVSVKGFPTIYFFKGDDKVKSVQGQELLCVILSLSSVGGFT
jgi:hypothetical protein